MSQDDVCDEKSGVGKSEDEAERLSRDPNVGEQVDAPDRKPQRQHVPATSHSERGEAQRTKKLDRPYRPKRQSRDGKVEERIHRREDHAELHEREPGLVGHRAPESPGAPPHGEHRRCARDPQPRHAEHVHAPEEQGGERGAEIVKDRADHEENVWRNTVRRPAGEVPARRLGRFHHEPQGFRYN